MTAHEAFADGDLAGAVGLQTAAVAARPDDPAARLVLAELLVFAGRLRDARDHLLAVPSNDPHWPAWRTFFRRLLRAEWRRTVRGRRPGIAPGPPPAHARRRWNAIRALKAGDPERAVRWIDRADDATPEVRGFVDGREFAGLRDADDRFASVLEAFADGRYLWFPWEAVRRIAVEPHAHPRDGWVRAAAVKLRDGSELRVHLPLLYPDSHADAGPFAAGLGTDHVCPDGGPVRCVGTKLLLCGEEEVPLGECRMIEVR